MESVTKNRAQVKAELERRGLTIEGWARRNGFHRSTVMRVINGKSLNRYGACHKIAVMLGIKDGVIEDS